MIEPCAVPGEARYWINQFSALGWSCFDSGYTRFAPAPARLRTATIEMSPPTMNAEEEHQLREQLARLQQEHRDLDAAISALQDTPGSEEIQVQRLKKRKLYLRDRITFIEDQLTPDIIA